MFKHVLHFDVASLYPSLLLQMGRNPKGTKEALEAWEYAAKVANDNIEREGVYLHMARVELNSGLFNAARQHINTVTNQMYEVLKGRLARNLAEKEAKAKNGSSPGAAGVQGDASINPPKPGEHTSELLRELGYDDAQIESLSQKKIIAGGNV